MTGTIPEPGQVVTVRQRPFVVTNIKKSETMPVAAGLGRTVVQHLVTLSSVEDEGLGEELQVIWELEPGVKCMENSQLPPLRAFDRPRDFDAFLDAVAWGAVSQADATALQAPFRSGIDVDDYQLDPVVRALSMPRVNLLLADDVGLGKTIETGLVAQELSLRHRVRTILVICPSSLQIQWRDEMRDKFGLEFRIVDSDFLKDLRRLRGIHANPWKCFPRLITSIDFLKRERPLRLFRETLPSGDEPPYPRRYDLMIVDEAHNVAPSGRGKYCCDSMRTKAIRTLAPHFEHKLFLTATPHNGYRDSFASLLELLDNQRFARAIEPNRAQLDAIMVRRMKSELELRWDGSRRFAERKVNHLEVIYTETEREAHRKLRRYSELRLKSAGTNGERMAVEFVLKLLKKRLFSSPASFAVTLEKHFKAVGSLQGKVSAGLLKQIEDADDDFANDEEYEELTLNMVESVSGHLAEVSAEEKQLLGELRSFATTATSKADSKANGLIDWLKKNIRTEDKWSDRRVIIFTEYRQTQKWLYDLLATHGFAMDDRLQMIYGGMQLEDREKVKAAFQADPKEAKVRILLATDAASEGLNLQNHCWQLIHFEIPWNPNRMEQRNGRIDRHGQKNPEVLIHHFVGKGFDKAKNGSKPGDLEGDLEFLMRAALKVEAIREDLGKVGPVIAEQVEEAMLGKRSKLDTSQTEKDAEPVRKMLKFERDLRKQLESLSEQLQETRRDLRLSPENIQNVVETGLRLAGQPPLRPASLAGIWPDPSGKRRDCPVFNLPPLSGSWAHCADGLLHPHTKQPRPIVFDQSLATGRDDLVLCHLNHRLVQMCLRLLRAEIWSSGGNHRLNRFSARLVPDNVLQHPAVIAHGRLLVLGGDNQRIHEEIIMAGGTIREGRFSRMNVGTTKMAYEAAEDHGIPESLGIRLKEMWPKLQDPLQQALEARMKDRTANLQSLLDERSAKEANSITVIMKELERSIREVVDTKDNQLYLEGFAPLELEQRERDRGALQQRLKEIPAELEQEIQHLQQRYQKPSPRLFPISVTFLVPHRVAAEIVQGGVR